MLSVIIPAYNEEAMLEKTASVIGGILADANIDCELIFVDDEVRLVDKSGNVLAKETIGNVRKITFAEDVATDLDSLQPTPIMIYPNPSHDIIHVDGIKPTDLRVFDLQGRMLLTDHGNQITVASLPEGTYLLQVGTQVVRFIKQ